MGYIFVSKQYNYQQTADRKTGGRGWPLSNFGSGSSSGIQAMLLPYQQDPLVIIQFMKYKMPIYRFSQLDCYHQHNQRQHKTLNGPIQCQTTYLVKMLSVDLKDATLNTDIPPPPPQFSQFWMTKLWEKLLDMMMTLLSSTTGWNW